MSELIKWKAGEKFKSTNFHEISVQDGHYFVVGKKHLIYKRILRKRISKRKILIAKKTARLLSFLPTIKMVALTGALCMENVEENADIDLLVISQKGTLWITRLASLLLVDIYGIKRRKYGDSEQKNRICINMWLDESDLILRKRNIYTAHEVAQLKPLIDKEKTYWRFIEKNKWVLNYWPNAIRNKKDVARRAQKKQGLLSSPFYSLLSMAIEPLVRKLQYWYMRGKITKETVTPTRAFFHPNDWSKIVLSRLGQSSPS